jgi:phosphatidylserine/phosphatidylglycerophosphate/cardiolipin synthase-like enzyme
LKKLLIFILLFTFIFAKEVYFMPMEGKKAENRLINLFTHAHKEIKIVIYSFTNYKLARALKKAARKGVKVYIIADKESAKYKGSRIPNLAVIKNIYIRLLSGKRYKNGNRAKMHVKLSIIDNKYLVTGSANYSYSAFYKNYEYILIDTDKELIQKFDNFYHIIYPLSTPYRLSR